MVPDRWLVLTVHSPSGDEGSAVAEGLIALGGTAVVEEPDGLTTYLPPPDDPETFVEEARKTLSDYAPDATLELSWRWQPNEDWAVQWRRGLRPRRVGERLIVAPTWTEPEPGPNDIVIWIDPQMAFGTGEHASTRGVLRLLESATRPGDRVLDVGTGSGILAIAAVRLGAEHVLAVESDPVAIPNARENLERNGVAAAVTLDNALVDDAYLDALGAGRVDLIVANVLSGVLIPLLPAFRRVLAPGGAAGSRAGSGSAGGTAAPVSVGHADAAAVPGRAILGGILTSEADRVVAAAEAAGFEVAREDVEEEWWSVLLTAR